jgi:hypothetical protein
VVEVKARTGWSLWKQALHSPQRLALWLLSRGDHNPVACGCAARWLR